MAELPGNSQKPLAFGTICPAAFLLSLIRKEWGWMQSTSPPLDVMRLCKLDLLYSISTPFFLASSCFSSFFALSFHVLSTLDFSLFFIYCVHIFTYLKSYKICTQFVFKLYTE